MGFRKKKERTHAQTQLIKDIGILEKNHKLYNSPLILHSLTQKREELKALFRVENTSRLRIISQQFYEWGNKPSRLLARLLRQKKSASYIAKIK